MTDDYVPRPTSANTGWIVGLLVLLLLVPLLLCGLGVIGFWSYTEVSEPMNIQIDPVVVPAEVQTPEEAPVEPEGQQNETPHGDPA